MCDLSCSNILLGPSEVVAEQDLRYLFMISVPFVNYCAGSHQLINEYRDALKVSVNLRWKSCVLLPSAGSRTQFFLPIFTEPGVHLLGHPCILNWYSPKVWSSLRKNSIVPTDALPQGRRESQLCAPLCSLLLSKGSCKKICRFDFISQLLQLEPRQPMHSQSAGMNFWTWQELFCSNLHLIWLCGASSLIFLITSLR